MCGGSFDPRTPLSMGMKYRVNTWGGKNKLYLEAKTEQHMQFGAVGDIYLYEQKDEILRACNVNQCDLYKSKTDNLHTMI